jgi:O-antigen/teichoic acid export membrane protein
MYLSGLCFATYVVAQGPVLQRHVPAGFMGRISSLSTPVLSVSSMLATAGVTAALARVDAGSMRADAADPNALALSVSAVIVMVGAGMMMLSLSRSATGVETDAKPLQR